MAFAVTQQHRHRLNAVVGNGYIKIAVAVEVSSANVCGILSGRERGTVGLREAALPITEINRKVAAATGRDEDVGVSVSVHIGDAQHRRMCACGKMHRPEWS